MFSKTGFSSVHLSAVEPECNFHENEGFRDTHFRHFIDNFGLVCTYADFFFFKKMRLFSLFSKKYVSTRSVFKSISPVHTRTFKRWKYDSIPNRACVNNNNEKKKKKKKKN